MPPECAQEKGADYRKSVGVLENGIQRFYIMGPQETGSQTTSEECLEGEEATGDRVDVRLLRVIPSFAVVQFVSLYPSLYVV